MLLRVALFCGIAISCLSANVVAQEPAKSSLPSDLDFPAFVRETQQQTNEPGYVGIVWWMPTEFWIVSAERTGVTEDRAASRYNALRRYTVVAMAIGKIGVANVNWVSEPELRENIQLRDSDGNIYLPVQKLSGDAEGLQSIIKPLFANLLGQMGQNIELFFFGATTKSGKLIADPFSPGSFSVILNKVVAGKDKTFEWKLPLTSLSPPKYCPVGKERMQANWKFCPWHGVKLDEPSPPATPPNKVP